MFNLFLILLSDNIIGLRVSVDSQLQLQYTYIPYIAAALTVILPSPPSFSTHSNVKAITKLNETELRLGLDTKRSWHDQYKESAYIFVGKWKKIVLVIVLERPLILVQSYLIPKCTVITENRL